MEIKANKLANFKTWLSSQGAEIMQPTNQYEVLRYRCKIGTGIIYSGKKGLSVNNNDVYEAWDCFINTKKKWVAKGKPGKRSGGSLKKRQLIDRDGRECFYCGDEFQQNELTLEHLVPIVCEGPDRLENLVLACKPCNGLAGRLPVIEKILLRS